MQFDNIIGKQIQANMLTMNSHDGVESLDKEQQYPTSGRAKPCCLNLRVAVLSGLCFSWIFIYHNLFPATRRISVAPSRLTHGFGIPKIRHNDDVCPDRCVPLNRNQTQFREEYGHYGQGDINTTTCLKEILIYGSINNILHYPEMAPILNLFTEQVGYSNTAHLVCPDINCAVGLRVGINQEYFKNKDVVVFGMLPKAFIGQLDALTRIKPLKRQTWVYYSTESPFRVLRWVKDMKLKDMQYHKLMTYHMDSEIPRPFGYFVTKTSPGVSDAVSVSRSKVDTLPNFAKNKTHLIAWMASNCEEIFWSRSMYVENLREYIHIDLYGRCGSLKCLPRDSEKCNLMLSKYKFYLALANSECRHYITENFWKTSLQYNIVPVIYGAPKVDVDRFAPPSSYIHAGDFVSPRNLANYLQIIDKNDTLYNSFFEWRNIGYVTSNFPPLPSLFCKMLAKLAVTSNSKEKTSLKTLGNSPWWRTCRYDVNMTSAVYTTHQKLAAHFKKWTPWVVNDSYK